MMVRPIRHGMCETERTMFTFISVAPDSLNKTGLRNLLPGVLQIIRIFLDRSVKMIAWVSGL
jgi:hypothetical protein